MQPMMQPGMMAPGMHPSGYAMAQPQHVVVTTHGHGGHHGKHKKHKKYKHKKFKLKKFF